MRATSLAALVVLAGIAIAGAAIAVKKQGAAFVAASTGEKLYGNLGARLNDVAGIDVETKDGVVVALARRDAGWVVTNKSDYPAKFEQIKKTLVGMADLKIIEAKTAKPELYPRLQVEDIKSESQSTRLSLKDARGQGIASLILGKRRPGRGAGGPVSLYVRRAGETPSWLVEGDFSLDADPLTWMEADVVDIAASRLREIAALQGDGTRAVLRKDKPEDKDFAVADLPSEAKTRPASDRNNRALALENLDLTDVAAAERLGLAGAPIAETEYRTFDGLLVRVRLFEKDGKTWARLAAEAFAVSGDRPSDDVAREAKDINARVAGWAYQFTDYKTSSFRFRLEDFLAEPQKPG